MITNVACVYLIILCSVLPLYMKNGYYELGEAKATCYIAISLIFFLILTVMGRITEKRTNDNTHKVSEHSSITEFFLYATFFSCMLSFVFSVDKKMAFMGFEGWRTGLLSYLLAIFFCIVFSGIRQVKKLPKPVIYLSLLVPFIEFILGIINRFGIYPVAIQGIDNSFVATLGNINWYSGFLAIFVPIGIGLVYLTKERTAEHFLSIIYTIPGIAALFLQGSDGAVLIMVGTVALLIWLGLDARVNTKKVLISLMVIGTGMTMAPILLYFFCENYKYEGGVLLAIIRAHTGIILVAAAFFLYRMERLFEEINLSYKSRIYKLIYSIILVVVIALSVVYIYSDYSDDFGNGRGLIWRVSVDVFKSMTPWQQLVGVGQDCMASYIETDAALYVFLLDSFNGNLLTNAHCELLNVLIERGLIGGISYIGLFVCAVYELIKAKETEPSAIICGLPLISYFLYNQVSFAQITSMPYAYVLIGMGLSILKQNKY